MRLQGRLHPEEIKALLSSHSGVLSPRRKAATTTALQARHETPSSDGEPPTATGHFRIGGLWPHGIIAVGHGFVDDRGRVGMKFGWWTKVPGRLNITGRRLDRPALPVRGVVPDGYGPRGFRPSGVTFPTEGCWEITGSVHRTELSFVTFVIKQNKGS